MFEQNWFASSYQIGVVVILGKYAGGGRVGSFWYRNQYEEESDVAHLVGDEFDDLTHLGCVQ